MSTKNTLGVRARLPLTSFQIDKVTQKSNKLGALDSSVGLRSVQSYVRLLIGFCILQSIQVKPECGVLHFSWRFTPGELFADAKFPPMSSIGFQCHAIQNRSK